MIFGIGLFTIGYAVWYWGLHHFPYVDCPTKNGCRYSLFDVLGVPPSWGLIHGKPVQMDWQSLPNTDQTQGQSSTNSTTGNKMTGGGKGWESDILAYLNAPCSTSNVAKLDAWNACEGNDPGKSGLGINNPFNVAGFGEVSNETCCRPSPVPTSRNNPPISQFPTLKEGCQATAIRMSDPIFTAIKNNLVSDGSQQAFANAVGSSGWGTSGSCIASTLKSGGH